MKSIFSIMTIIFLTISICKGQTQHFDGCFIWKSDYYKGDFEKICLYQDNSFYYQRHQNDVWPDYFSKGKWHLTNNLIELKSIEHLLSDSQIIIDGNPIKDSIYLTVVDTKKGWKLSHFIVDIFNSNMTEIGSVMTDSLGRIAIQLNSDAKYLKSQRYLDFHPILINLDNVKQERILIKMNEDNLIYKDISKKTFSIQKQGILNEEIEDGTTIKYYRQK